MNNKKIKITFFSNLVIIFMLSAFFSLTIISPFKSVSGDNQNNVFYSGNTQNNLVSFLINVYWGNEFLPDMLNVLRDNQVTTTFFVGGSWVEKYPNVFLEIVKDGHEIGNHGFFHKDQSKLDYSENQSEILATHKIVREFSGVSMNLFAPPSGYISNSVVSAAVDLGYRVIMWTKDTIDWRDDDVDLIVSRATSKIKPGDLILMHPTRSTVVALPIILDKIRQSGLNVGIVSKNI